MDKKINPFSGLLGLTVLRPQAGDAEFIGPILPSHIKLAILEKQHEELERNHRLLARSDSLDFLSEDEFLVRLLTLAKSKGVDLDNINWPLALLREVLPDLKDFARPAGRPKTRKTKDYLRYLAVRSYKIEQPVDGEIADVTAIRALCEQGHELFSRTKGHLPIEKQEKALQSSVSNGRSTWEKAREEVDGLRRRALIDALMKNSKDKKQDE